MSTLSATVNVHVPPATLFTFLAARWESGAALGPADTEATLVPAARMATGLRVPCSGAAWAIVGDVELEVLEYDEPSGWRAVSRPGARFDWTVRIAQGERAATLTCVLRYAPPGLADELRERFGDRRRRRRALRQRLAAWKLDAERQEALGRLRAALHAERQSRPRGEV